MCDVSHSPVFLEIQCRAVMDATGPVSFLRFWGSVKQDIVFYIQFKSSTIIV